MFAVYATIADIESRHPAELIVLAGDETTGVRDDERVRAALEDASIEVRTILKARYAAADLGRLDADSLASLRLYTIDIALHRVALSFSRGSDEVEARANRAIKRLEAIASGKGELTLESGAGDEAGSTVGSAGDAAIGANEVVIDAPERVFTRARMRGL